MYPAKGQLHKHGAVLQDEMMENVQYTCKFNKKHFSYKQRLVLLLPKQTIG
jgi:hypothetical protein